MVPWIVLVSAGSFLVLIHLLLALGRGRSGRNYGIQVQQSRVEGSVNQRSTVYPSASANVTDKSKTLLVLGIILSVTGIVEKLTGIFSNIIGSS